MKALIPVALACALFSAQAHITVEYAVAPAASSYKAAFKVGHGCGESPTRQVIVHIPAGVASARPMPKAGWSIAIEKDKDAVTRVAWTAKSRDEALANAHYDEFVLLARLPAQAGPLYWPVEQVCEQGRHDWTQVPQPGQRHGDLKSPAAYLEILPAHGAGAQHH